MIDQRLQDCVKAIELSDTRKKRIQTNVIEAAQKTNSLAVFLRRNRRAAVLALIFFLALPLPALAASVEPIYQLMYLVSPALAQSFQPIQKSMVDEGIRMEVVSSYVNGDTVQIYITMQDLTGDRIRENTDLYDSYEIYQAFDSTGRCERVGYDAASKTATFLITLSRMDGKPIPASKVTFVVREFLSYIPYDNIEIPIDLQAIPTHLQGQKDLDFSGGGGAAYEPDSFRALVPEQPNPNFPIDEVSLTGIAFLDGKLHIQTRVEHHLQNDHHGYFYLIDAEGNQIISDATYGFRADFHGNRVRYTEEVFSITPQELAHCKLYANFRISTPLTKGNWRVTFPLVTDNET